MGESMYFILAILLLFGESMVQGAVLNFGKITDFIHKVSKKKPIIKNYHSFINHGKSIAHAVVDGSLSVQTFDRKKYLNNIISFAWYLYAIAIEKGQGFTSGVMVIQDSDQAVYNFLYEYVRQVNPKNLMRRSLISLNPYGYSRQSTHFPSDQKKFIQYGIDIRFSTHQKAQRLLPASKAHILFGRLGRGLTFIKFERHGLYLKDGFVGHTIGFLRHIAGRAFSYVVSQQDKALHRKEYIPEWIKSACKGFLFKKKPASIRDIVQASYTDARFNPLVLRIAEKYDHLEMRHGGEVIISRKEIDDFCEAL